jgi:hypothetical protein
MKAETDRSAETANMTAIAAAGLKLYSQVQSTEAA